MDNSGEPAYASTRDDANPSPPSRTNNVHNSTYLHFWETTSDIKHASHLTVCSQAETYFHQPRSKIFYKAAKYLRLCFSQLLLLILMTMLGLHCSLRKEWFVQIQTQLLSLMRTLSIAMHPLAIFLLTYAPAGAIKDDKYFSDPKFKL